MIRPRDALRCKPGIPIFDKVLLYSPLVQAQQKDMSALIPVRVC